MFIKILKDHVKSMVLLLCKNEGRRAVAYGWQKTEAYSAKKAGRQSRKEKTEHKRTESGQVNARLSYMALAGSQDRMDSSIRKTESDGCAYRD